MTATADALNLRIRVDHSNGVYQVITSPYPMHRATVARSRALGMRWVVNIHTAGVLATDHPTMAEALQTAGVRISALYRLDMRSRFTGPQRHAMAMGMCPAQLPTCADDACTIGTPHSHLCRRNPWLATIWCERHQRVMEGTWQT